MPDGFGELQPGYDATLLRDNSAPQGGVRWNDVVGGYVARANVFFKRASDVLQNLRGQHGFVLRVLKQRLF